MPNSLRYLFDCCCSPLLLYRYNESQTSLSLHMPVCGYMRLWLLLLKSCQPAVRASCHVLLLNRYLESQTTSSRKAHLGSSIAIGAGTSIGDDCNISRCVIGRGCIIGKGCSLHGCYLQVGIRASAQR